MDECELISLVTAAACSIAKCCSDDEISILSAVFTQLGDTLQTILTQRELKEQAKNPREEADKENGNSENISCNIETKSENIESNPKNIEINPKNIESNPEYTAGNQS